MCALSYKHSWNLKIHSSPFCAWLWVCLSVGHRKTLEPRRLVHAACKLLYLLSETNITRKNAYRKRPEEDSRVNRPRMYTDMTLFLECYCSWISVECKWAVIIGTTCGSCFIAIEYKHTTEMQFQRPLLHWKSFIVSVPSSESHGLRVHCIRR